MTTAAPGGRRLASTNRLTCSVGDLSPHCNPDATTDRICPIDCIPHHTDLETESNHLVTRCNLCGMHVDLDLWNHNVMHGTRPWSRWGRDADAG